MVADCLTYLLAYRAAFVSVTASRSGQGPEPGTLLGKDDPFVPEPGIDALFSRKTFANCALEGSIQRFDRSLSGSSWQAPVSTEVLHDDSWQRSLRPRRAQEGADLRRRRRDQSPRCPAHRHERLRRAQGRNRRAAVEGIDGDRLLPARQSRHSAGADRRSLCHDGTLLRASARDQGAISPRQGHQCRLGIQKPGTAIDRHAGPERILPDHLAANGRDSGRRATNCRASRRRCSPSSAPIGRSA